MYWCIYYSLLFFHRSEKPTLYNFDCQQGLMVLSSYALKILWILDTFWSQTHKTLWINEKLGFQNINATNWWAQ